MKADFVRYFHYFIVIFGVRVDGLRRLQIFVVISHDDRQYQLFFPLQIVNHPLYALDTKFIRLSTNFNSRTSTILVEHLCCRYVFQYWISFLDYGGAGSFYRLRDVRVRGRRLFVGRVLKYGFPCSENLSTGQQERLL